MADGTSFFRGGTEANTRLSSFSRNKGKKPNNLINQTERKGTSRPTIPRTRGKSTGKISEANQANGLTHEVTQKDTSLETDTEGRVTTLSSRSASQTDGWTDRFLQSPQSQSPAEKRDDLVFSERQLTRLATFLDDALIKVPTSTKLMETQQNAPKPQKVKTFYVEKWPEPEVKLDNTISAYTRIISRGPSATKNKTVLGGEPITIDTAKDLRLATYGTTIHCLSSDWKKAGILFQNSDSPFSYGLVTPKIGGARGILLAIQGHILQHLLFNSSLDSTDLNILRPSPSQRRSAVVRAICDMLWKAGCGLEGFVCLPQEGHTLNPQPGYRDDGITEKLHIFKFRSYEDLESFVKRNFNYFEGDHGCLLFLYGLILSRGFYRIADDQGLNPEKYDKLLTDTEQCSFSLINLLLTGRAVRFLHNGVSLYDEFGDLMPKPLKGVEERCPVGFLFLDKSESPRTKTQVGSMLKTPKFPIWLTQVNGIMGMLFSTNPELVSHWRVEHRFLLHYFTGQPTQKSQTSLSIDTRFNKRGRIKTALARRDQEEKAPALETVILTKWFDADINWNGTAPYY